MLSRFWLIFMCFWVPGAALCSSPKTLEAWVEEALAVSTPTRSSGEFAAAVATFREVLEGLDALDIEKLSRDEQIDADLLRRQPEGEVAGVMLDEKRNKSFVSP